VSPKNAISELIERIEKEDSDFREYRGWVPSHTWLVIDEHTGIEAAASGIRYFELSKYFDDPTCQIVSYRPAGLTVAAIQQILGLAEQLSEEKLGYDYGALAGDTIEGLIGIDNLIPELKAVADPLHSSHRLFCSALVSTLLKGTAQYQDVDLFKTYTASKISPLRLMMQFPYDAKFTIKEVQN